MDFNRELNRIKSEFIKSQKTTNQVISDFNLLYENIQIELNNSVGSKNKKIYPSASDKAEQLNSTFMNFSSSLNTILMQEEYLSSIFKQAFYEGNYSFILCAGSIIMNSKTSKKVKKEIEGIFLAVLELTDVGDLEKQIKELSLLKIIVFNYLFAAKEGLNNWFDIAQRNETTLRNIFKLNDPYDQV